MKTVFSKQLSRAFDFTAEDLAANQRGELTDHQRSRIWGLQMWPLLLNGVMLIFPAIVFMTVSQRPIDLTDFVLLVFASLWTLFWVALGWFTFVHTRSDLQTGEVLSAAGVAQLRETRGYRGKRIFYVKIGDVEFCIDPVSPWAFKNGQRYQVFYVPTTNIIVSAVRLDEWGNSKNLTPSPSPSNGEGRKGEEGMG